MKYCEKCGAKIDDTASFCSLCGAPTGFNKNRQTKTRIEDAFNSFTNTTNTTADYSPEDINKNRLMSIVAYLGVLCIIPLFVAKDSPFARFHTNQGLVLFLLNTVCSIFGVIPTFGWIIMALISIFCTVLMVIGIINAVKGEAKELPLIGKIKILK